MSVGVILRNETEWRTSDLEALLARCVTPIPELTLLVRVVTVKAWGLSRTELPLAKAWFTSTCRAPADFELGLALPSRRRMLDLIPPLQRLAIPDVLPLPDEVVSALERVLANDVIGWIVSADYVPSTPLVEAPLASTAPAAGDRTIAMPARPVPWRQRLAPSIARERLEEARDRLTTLRAEFEATQDRFRRSERWLEGRIRSLERAVGHADAPDPTST